MSGFWPHVKRCAPTLGEGGLSLVGGGVMYCAIHTQIPHLFFSLKQPAVHCHFDALCWFGVRMQTKDLTPVCVLQALAYLTMQPGLPTFEESFRELLFL